MAYCPRTRYEVEALLAQAQAAAGRIIKAAQDVFWGGYSGNFADPDGHLGEVAWNPDWSLDDQRQHQHDQAMTLRRSATKLDHH